MQPPLLMDRGGAEKSDRHGGQWLLNPVDPSAQAPSLAELHRSLSFPTDDQLRWLLDQGIDCDAMALPWSIRGATVCFDGTTFDFERAGGAGERAIIFRAEDRGQTIDFLAWSPSADKLTSWYGIAFCLGDQDQIFNPASYFGGDCLEVHASPLEWLRSGRQGIVIVTPKLTQAFLGGVSRLMFADAGHKRLVRRWLSMKRLLPEMLVAGERAVA